MTILKRKSQPESESPPAESPPTSEVETFSTASVYEASWLVLDHHNVISITVDDVRSVKFIFNRSADLFESLQRYRDGALVNASAFAGEATRLFSALMSMKRYHTGPGDGR